MLQMTRKEQIGALVLAGMLVLGLVIRFALTPKTPGEFVIEAPEESAGELEVNEVHEIMVHVAGAVQNPGVYTLSDGARIYEALEAAGGVLPDGDAHALNLAEPLYDGRRINVPFAEDVETPTGGVAESGKVNINTATAAELEALPGIGPAKAAAISSYREENGPFRSVEDLVQVSGIGVKTVESLKEHITLY
ncbi:helix-hairpin-helix domain-containing protein [Dethiobacter alkaliphilus]|uniref:Competence protein ComEA helix-hairpin-helix repeat protein n=1 Tax=Dethiobacter alkaliphilus AHT 1 TaxID=555088 RepID=C0GEP7_DETAL|nr:ComEA family DNA-binding protein [Dethiobacter alkaliphilus]EEG78079.1 competence protein ComEA helix-hairpin-helix repeat protein [Dethiobacter alkaliphilus AHT 1]